MGGKAPGEKINSVKQQRELKEEEEELTSTSANASLLSAIHFLSHPPACLVVTWAL